ncbi:MAG: glycosyltransferase [Casimicrobiaceae bacterium]
MPDSMRVLHVTTGLDIGGAEMMLLKVISASDRERFTHAVVSLGPEGTLAPRFREAGLEVQSLGASPLRPRLGALRARIRAFDPALIQGWMYHGNVAATLGRGLARSRAALAWNIRQTLYDLRNEKRFTAGVIRTGALLSRLPDAIIYNSATSATQHEKLGYDPRRRKLLPNGFDCAAFAPDAEARARVRLQLGMFESDVVIGLVTRYHPMKDHMTFVAAAAHVAATHPQARFLLVGRDVSAPDAGIVAALDRAGLREKALVLDERDDMPDVYNALDIACSSSAWGEGFSNAIGEAMACGVPCVVTDVGDSAAIVAETGVAVPARDPKALAAAIGQFVAAGPERRQALGSAARQRIVEHYALPAIVADYEALYEALIRCDASTPRSPSPLPTTDR